MLLLYYITFIFKCYIPDISSRSFSDQEIKDAVVLEKNLLLGDSIQLEIDRYTRGRSLISKKKLSSF